MNARPEPDRSSRPILRPDGRGWRFAGALAAPIRRPSRPRPSIRAAWLSAAADRPKLAAAART